MCCQWVSERQAAEGLNHWCQGHWRGAGKNRETEALTQVEQMFIVVIRFNCVRNEVGEKVAEGGKVRRCCWIGGERDRDKGRGG